MPLVALVNPNTSVATTARMVEIARDHAANALEIEGVTVPFGADLITNQEELEVSSRAVASLVPALSRRFAGAIVSAFGDPGLEELRRALAVPIAGIGEAGILEAGHGGRRFAVVTTTPDLVSSIDAKAARLGLGASYAGVVLTKGEPVALTADAPRLEAALGAVIEEAIVDRRVDAVVIGGGPLAVAARALAPRFQIPIVEPIPAAVRWLELALRQRA
jgi:allantoin racemase